MGRCAGHVVHPHALAPGIDPLSGIEPFHEDTDSRLEDLVEDTGNSWKAFVSNLQLKSGKKWWRIDPLKLRSDHPFCCCRLSCDLVAGPRDECGASAAKMTSLGMLRWFKSSSWSFWSFALGWSLKPFSREQSQPQVANVDIFLPFANNICWAARICWPFHWGVAGCSILQHCSALCQRTSTDLCNQIERPDLFRCLQGYLERWMFQNECTLKSLEDGWTWWVGIRTHQKTIHT